MEPANILHIKSLGNGWLDKDYVMLHACFQILTDFYELEYLPSEKNIDWNVDDEHRFAQREIIELYQWWQHRKEEPDGSSFKEDYDQYLADNKMLKRLIDVRMYLWT